jgi:hypothetical protein
VDLLLGTRLPVVATAGSAGLLAGCRVDLPVHAALCINRKNALIHSFALWFAALKEAIVDTAP